MMAVRPLGKPLGLTTDYTICAYVDVLTHLQRAPHDVVLSIEHPGAVEGKGLSPVIAAHGHRVPQHKFIYWDNDLPGAPEMCTAEIATASLDVMRRHRGGRILVHCRGGKARSTATALMGVADELGAGREDEAVAYIDAIRNIATPNPLVVRLADDLLRRNGALVAAVARHAAIAARMPEWYIAKLRSMAAFHSEMDPEKAMPFLNAMSAEERADLLRVAEQQAWAAVNEPTPEG